MVTFVLQVIIVHQAPDTHMSSPVLLAHGATHLGLRACRRVGFALLVSSAIALASFSQQEYVLQVCICIISHPYRILFIFTPDWSSLPCHKQGFIVRAAPRLPCLRMG